MATSVPQFNLKEVNSALIKIIQNPLISFDEIYCVPDFATGGTIINAKEVKESLKNGHGASIKLRAKLEYFPDRHMIQATELPYGVYTNTVLEQIKTLTDEDENYGIEKVIDHTKKVSDIRIYLSKEANPKKMIEKLYRDTSLENWFAINMIMLDMGRFPKVFGWKDACEAYIAHIRKCKYREIEFDLNKALARENILNGLIQAAANIDEVVKIIRDSSDPSDASKNLKNRFKFNDEQAKAILAMKLSALTRIDAIKLNEELAEIVEKITYFQYLLNTPKALDEELIKILQEVSDKFGDNRRTKSLDLIEENNSETEELDLACMVFDNNFIRLIPTTEMVGGKKGKKGISIKPPKNANLINTLYTTSIGSIAIFTSKGKMYNLSLKNLELNIDYSIYGFINIDKNEKIIKIIDSTSFFSYKYILFITKNGFVKKTLINEYKSLNKRSQTAIKLKDDDYIINVFLSSDEKDKLMIFSNNGNYVFFDHYDITPIGKNSIGVKGIKLKDDEYVVAATLIYNSKNYYGLLTINNNGKGKISSINDFPETSRYVKGNVAQKIDKDDTLSTAYGILQSQEKIFILANNKAVEIKVKDLPRQGRLTTGSKIVDSKNKKVEILQC